MLPTASSNGVSLESRWDNSSGKGLNGNGFGQTSQRNEMFSPTPGLNQSMDLQQSDMEESFSLSNVYDDFALLLENLHFNVYKDVFDVVKEFGRVSSSR